MKFLKHLFALLTICFLLQTNALADTKINWFVKNSENNSQPQILGGDKRIDEFDILYMGEQGDKTVYLTFDAGYSNENVEKILDTLKSHNVKAAFFILPGIIKNSPETVKRMYSEGHLVCNHTTTHKDISQITEMDKFKEELETLESIYKDATGQEMTKYFRPPEGAFSLKTLEFCKDLGYTPVFWSFAYADWDDSKQIRPEKAKDKIFNNLHDGAVLLLHPTSATNAYILDDVINEIKNRGYSLGTLDELKAKQTQ